MLHSSAPNTRPKLVFVRFRHRLLGFRIVHAQSEITQLVRNVQQFVSKLFSTHSNNVIRLQNTRQWRIPLSPCVHVSYTFDKYFSEWILKSVRTFDTLLLSLAISHATTKQDASRQAWHMIQQQPEPKPIAVRAREAAKLLGVSQRTFDRVVAAGDIPFWRLHGRSWRMFAVKDLEAYVDRRRKQEARHR